MHIMDVSFDDPARNVSFDEALLVAAEKGDGGEALRFWESPCYFVVLGRTSVRENDVHAEAVARDGIKVVRRVSAGGTVLQGPGCLNYSLVLSYERDRRLMDIRASYGYILGAVAASLQRLGVNARWEPVSDLALDAKKFSGNAQARRRRYIMHHGTILYDFRPEMVERYIRMPREPPAYRACRGHGEFLTNVSIDPAGFKRELAGELAEVNTYA